MFQIKYEYQDLETLNHIGNLSNPQENSPVLARAQEYLTQFKKKPLEDKEAKQKAIEEAERIKNHLQYLINEACLKKTIPLDYAVQQNWVPKVKYLLEIQESNLDEIVIQEGEWIGWTLLAFAVHQKNEDMVILLLNHGAYPNQVIAKGEWKNWTLLAYAIFRDQTKIATQLLKNGASSNDHFINGSWAGWSLITYAVRGGQLEITKCLLKHGVNANQTIEKGDWKGWSLLAYAVRDGRPEIAKCLLEHGAEPNQTIENGDWRSWSLLAYAVYNKQVSLANYLIEKGADYNQKFPENCRWSGHTLSEYISKQELQISAPGIDVSNILTNVDLSSTQEEISANQDISEKELESNFTRTPGKK